jgi:hypothetical protein
VDHRVHASERVHVVRDFAGLFDVGQISDDDCRAAADEVADRVDPVAVAHVDDDVVSVVEQRLRSQASETVRGAGDEDAAQRSIMRAFASP